MKFASLFLFLWQAATAPVPTTEGFVWATPDGQDQKADLYLPKGAGPFPVAVFFAWRRVE